MKLSRNMSLYRGYSVLCMHSLCLTCIIQEHENLFTKLCTEFTQVRQALQNRQAQNPISDNFRHQQNLHSTKKEQVNQCVPTVCACSGRK